MNRFLSTCGLNGCQTEGKEKSSMDIMRFSKRLCVAKLGLTSVENKNVTNNLQYG